MPLTSAQLAALKADAAAALAAANKVNADVAALVADAGPPPPVQTPVITPVSAQSCQVGKPFSLAMVASRGTAPYHWSASGLPTGLSINAGTGVISGTPTTAGSNTVQVSLSDSQTPPVAAQTVAVALTVSAAPPPSSGVTVAVITDIHTDESAPATTNAIGALVHAAKPAAVIVGGDMSTNWADGGSAQYEAAMGDLFLMVDPALGNHDFDADAKWTNYWATWNQRPIGSAGKHWSSYDVPGTNWHVVLLQVLPLSEPGQAAQIAAGSAQLTWLAADLTANAGKHIIAVWHEPPFGYSNYGAMYNSNLSGQAAIRSLLQKAKCELTIHGHHHYYARIQRIDNAGKIDPTYPVEVIAGRAGDTAHTFNRPNDGLCLAGPDTSSPNIVVLTLRDTTFDVEYRPIAGGHFSDKATYQCLRTATPPPPPPPPTGTAKVYVGGWVQNDPAKTSQFVTAAGGNPAKSVMMAFSYGADWATVQSSSVGMAQTLAAWPGIKCLAVPMQTTGAPGNYNDVISGSQDGVFTAIANACATAGVTQIRLGWEYQNNPSGNMPAPVPAGQFVACFQHIVTVMRKAAPNLRFIYNPNDGTNAGNNPDWKAAYPGKSFVDILALDAYDNNSGWSAALSGATPNLNDIAALAAADGHDLALPEWSCIPAGSGYSSGDQPGFADQVFAWAEAQAQAGRNVYLTLWGDGYPGGGTWGAQCSPNFLAEVKAKTVAGIAAGMVAG